MSKLIDEIRDETTFRLINGKHYVAKPVIPHNTSTVIKRIKDAYWVLIGKSYAYHYKEDE